MFTVIMISRTFFAPISFLNFNLNFHLGTLSYMFVNSYEVLRKSLGPRNDGNVFRNVIFLLLL